MPDATFYTLTKKIVINFLQMQLSAIILFWQQNSQPQPFTHLPMTKRLSNLTPIPISDLLGRSFFVPTYQRGYRWTARQVTDLLDDVLAFVQKPALAGAFYCLQPIVVADADGRCDLIDGQQRLTTLSLILTYFNSRSTEEEAWNTFSMEYETREASRAYLTKPDPDRKNDNVDFHHIYHAYQAIRDWFAPRKTLRNDMESAFLNKVKVIWYEVNTAEDPIAIFTRLNIGKIPLTNAELVKGLFLRASNFAAGEPVLLCQMKQAKIAQEWDDIERRLQEDSFWYFLTNRTTTSNRIDFLLRLRADEVATAHVLPDDPSYVFLAFAEHLNRDGVDHAAEWARIKQLFLHLDEWYRDREFYHLIGFLTATGAAIPTLMQLGHGRSKRAFRASLKSLILEQVLRSRTALDRSTVAPALQEHLDDLDYDSVRTRPKIKEALLLFNIATLLESDKVKARFPFDLFKGEAWDIEHVRAVHSALPDAVEGARKWLATMLTYATGHNTASGWAEGIAASPGMQHAGLCLRALRLLEKEPFDKEQFALLARELIEHYDPAPDREADNTIGNLTLLDAATNRSYKNAVFPAKRKTLIALDKSGTFVPVCTKNVFLKYYSPRIDGMLVWTGEDAAAHQAAMHETLVRFFENSEIKV